MRAAVFDSASASTRHMAHDRRCAAPAASTRRTASQGHRLRRLPHRSAHRRSAIFRRSNRASFPAIRSLVKSWKAQLQRYLPARALASPGSAASTAIAGFAATTWRISATIPSSPATRSNGGYAQFATVRADFRQSTSRRARPHRRCAAALRRRHRLPQPARCRSGARRARRALRFRQLRLACHSRASLVGLRGLRGHARRDPSQGRRIARRRVGRRRRREAARGARPRHHLRTEWQGRGQRARGAAQGRSGRRQCHSPRPDARPSTTTACLWGERQLRSVANMTRQDARDFLALARDLKFRPTVQTFLAGRGKPRARSRETRNRRWLRGHCAVASVDKYSIH